MDRTHSTGLQLKDLLNEERRGREGLREKEERNEAGEGGRKEGRQSRRLNHLEQKGTHQFSRKQIQVQVNYYSHSQMDRATLLENES